MLLKYNIKIVLALILGGLLLGKMPTASAQDSVKNIFFERINDTEVRFFYDQNYFLVDKNCEFRAIERIAHFDKVNNNFDGDFTDIGPDGQVILTGSYTRGEKNGLFIAYHANQQKKWEVTFQSDKPVGYWNYFYPDGKPLLSVSFHDATTRVVSLWDQRGKLQVNQGNGRYEFRNPIDGFSEYGFPFYTMKGRIKDGLPNGLWNIYYEDPEARRVEHVAEESYRSGAFVRGYNYFDDADYSAPVFSILPYNNFYRAETLFFKPCTYDDFVGFTMYLAEYLRSSFRELRVNQPIDAQFVFEVRVRKDGSVRRVEVLKPLPEAINNGFKAVVQSLSFFVPSFKNGEYVDDVAIVHGRVSSTADGSLHFQTDSIERKLEQE